MKSRFILIGLIAGAAVGGLVLWVNHDRSGAPVNQSAQAPMAGKEAKPPQPATTPVPTLSSNMAPRAVQIIAGQSRGAPGARWKAVRELGHNLSADEVGSLVDYLRNHEAETNKAMRGVLKNEVILALKSQAAPPANLASVLREIFNDPNQDVVVRDYALQHLITWYDKSGEQTAIQDLLWKALAERDSSIAGTALLGLHRLARYEPDLDGNRIGNAALEMVQSDTTGELTRITAMQVCAERGVSAALPAIVPVAASAGNPLPLRISAVSAVAALGGQDQIPFLEGLRAETNSPIQTAVTAALKKLRATGGKG